ncbi:peptidylprolyl isomerase [Brevundimonas lutea]|uniref:peptidylprolyl isomerase n=1 Tax=Brevundimonas lutea TaxID=2293980 RepID=UPI001F0C514E|nr:peptidylprolyl isomerase [Brevundimonas lutea]
MIRLSIATVGVAMAALIAASPAVSQITAQPTPAEQPPAGAPVDPAAEQAPRVAQPVEPEFQLAEGIVALVNDDPITSFDLRQRMLTLIAESQAQPTEETIPLIQRQALQALIDQRLQWQEVQRYIDQVPALTDEEVEAQVASIAQQAGTTPQNYLAYFQQAGIRPETVREQLRVEGSWRRLVGARFNQRATVSRGQVQQTLARLNENQAKPQYLIGEIFIDASRVGGQQAALGGAQQLFDQIVGGAPFQAVAQQFSSLPTASSGGDAGWLLLEEAPPAIQPALQNMQPGQVSRPIPATGGVWLVYMRDRRDGSSAQLATLRQIMIPAPQTASDAEVAAATSSLEALRAGLTCDNILERGRATEGVTAADLGEADVADLAPQFQQFARTGEIGSVSSPIRTPLGVHLVSVCNRRVGGADAPSFDDVQARLENQHISMLARRYIRDVREEATIDVKG